MTLSWAGQVWERVDVCCGLVGLAGGMGTRTGRPEGADRTCVWQGRNTGDRRSLSRWLAVRGRAQDRLASGRAGGSGPALPHAVAAGRIASPEMFPNVDPLPHLKCSRPGWGRGDSDEAGEHGDAG